MTQELKKLILAPFAGLLFLMFLPAIGFILTVQAFGMYTFKLVTTMVKGMTIPAPPVGASHLTGYEPPQHPTELEKIEDELRHRQNR